jgi:hypothetical protein
MEPARNQKIQQIHPHQELVRNTIDKNRDAQMSEIYNIALKNIVSAEVKSFNDNFCVYYHRINPPNYIFKEEFDYPDPTLIKPTMLSHTSGRGLLPTTIDSNFREEVCWK